jgi:predicted phage terminase large subunit-like protein
MRRKAEIGERAFAQEYLNQPLSAAEQLFPDSAWHCYDPRLLERRGATSSYDAAALVVAIGVDPAVGELVPGESGSARDWFVAAVVGMAWSEGGATDEPARPLSYVLDLLRMKAPFGQQLSALAELSRLWMPRRIGIESVAYQAALSHEALSRGLPVVALNEQRSKRWRFELLASQVQRGEVLLPLLAPWAAELRREAAEYPAGPHDDQLDALARAVECGLQLLGTGGTIELPDSGRWSSKWKGY